MSDPQEHELPEFPIEILKNTRAIIEQLHPSIQRTLGGIATIAYAGAEQDWVNNLTDITHEVQEQLDQIFAVLNDVNTRPLAEGEADELHSATVKDPRTDEPAEQEAIETTQLDDIERKILAYALETGSFRTEHMKRDIPELAAIDTKEFRQFRSSVFPKIRERIAVHLEQQGMSATWHSEGVKRAMRYSLVINGEPRQAVDATEASETPQTTEADEAAAVPAEQDQEQAVTHELDYDPKISPHEFTIVKAAVTFLQKFEERQGLKVIMKEVFGKSHLPKDEERRLVQVLDLYAQKGVLRVYGKSYGYKSEADQELKTVPEISRNQDDVLMGDDADLFSFVVTNAQNGEINVGQIVREYLGVVRLPADEFHAFCQRLNALADRGYLVHAGGSPWYGVSKQDLPPVQLPKPEENLPVISTPVVDAYAPKEQKRQKETRITAAYRGEKHQQDTIIDASDSFTELGLSPRDELIFEAMRKAAKPGEWFQQKTLDFSTITFSSESARRQAFSKLTLSLIDKGVLVAEGIKGGRKYQFIASPAQKPAEAKIQDNKTNDVTQSATEEQPKYFEQAKQKPVETTTAASTEQRPLSEREKHAQSVRAARFAGRLATYVTNQLEANEDGKEKLAVLSKDISEKLHITVPAARAMVKELVESGHFYLNGHRKGSRLVALVAPEENISAREGGTKKELSSKERAKLWTEEDVDIAIMVCDSLLELQHHQQSKPIKNVMKELGVPEQGELEFKRTIRKLHDAGYIELRKNVSINSTSPHSSTIRVPVVGFPGQQAKMRWKEERKQVIAEFKGAYDLFELGAGASIKNLLLLVPC